MTERSGRRLAGARVLVTGATGFIGSHLCARLAAEGCDVHASTRRAVDGPIAGQVRWWQADLGDAAETGRLLGRVEPDVVFHLASHVSGARDVGAVEPTLRGNLLGAVHLLVATTERGRGRVVLAGSMEEPGADDVVPVSPYAAAKGAASAYGRMFHALYGTRVSIARIFMVYGPGQADTRKLVPYVVRSFDRGESPRVSSGTRPVDWIYVDDVVDGLIALAAAEGVDGRAVDLGSGTAVTVRALVERIASIMEARVPSRFGAIEDRPLERVRVADVEDAAARIGWTPAVDLDRGLRRTVAWYREHP